MIVVVGAGLAGLSAAHSLISAGHPDVLVIEAKSRAGGRIESHELEDGSILALGAQWLHGAEQNPVYHWLKDMNLIKDLESEEVEFDGVYRTQSGLRPPEDLVNRILELLLDAKHVLYKMSGTLDPSCKPIDVYRRHIRNALKSDPKLKSADRKMIFAIMRWFELYETIDNSCRDLSYLSMKAYSEWTDFDDGQMVKLTGGWQGVINKLIGYIGSTRILLDCIVEKISYTNDHVIVQHSKGVVFCDHVICTQSVGVLKSLPIDFFEPPLPDQRLSDLEAIGFDVANKIFLRFESPFLQEERGLKFLWVVEEEEEKSDEEDESTPPTRAYDLPDWCYYVTGLDLVEDSPNVLLAWIGGDGAREMENFTAEQIGQCLLKMIGIFLPDQKPTKLLSTVCSRWASDQFIKGAYSYESMAALKVDKDKLWEPITMVDGNTKLRVPKILFAGEATSTSMYATAHGAIVSGWREAERLSKYLKGV